VKYWYTWKILKALNIPIEFIINFDKLIIFFTYINIDTILYVNIVQSLNT